MCFIIGQFISAGVLRGFVHRVDEWGYRIPYALQWIWPIVLIPAIWFAPESPWHLVRKNRLEEAENSIRRLQSGEGAQDPKQTLATIVYTNNLEEQLCVGTAYRDCFKGFELRRTEIACVCFGGQLVCGLVFAYASTYFFQQVGLDVDAAYSLGWGANALALFACFVNWVVLMPRFGRRTIYIWGMAAMAIELCLIGILNVWTHRREVAWVQAILTLVWTFTFQLSAGQLGWALPAEIGSTRLRQKTVCLARNVSNILGVIGGTLNNYMVNPTAWNFKGYTGFVWGACAWAVFIWAYFRLPETKVSQIIHPHGHSILIALSRTAPSTNSTSSSPRKSLPANSPQPKWTPSTSTSRTTWPSNTLPTTSPASPSFRPSPTSWRTTGGPGKRRRRRVPVWSRKVSSGGPASALLYRIICARITEWSAVAA